MKEALLYEPLEKDRVRCNICQRRCVIDRGEYGFCHTRVNQKGKLFTLAYGQVATISCAPIEMKPLFHFYPGSLWLSLGTLGCNFLCPGCQNWEIAHQKFTLNQTPGKTHATEYLSPQNAVSLAKEKGCTGLSFTYNEPAVWFEYTLDCAKLAKKEGLLTNYVTNGFITKWALDTIGPWLDAYRVDVKGFSDEFYRKLAGIQDFRGIMQVAKRAKELWKMHVEIVTNIIPGWNDDDDQLYGIAKCIANEIGPDTPWHVTRFVPHLKLSNLRPTPLKTLERALSIGSKYGLNYVYIGNVSGHRAGHTYCPGCRIPLIERGHFSVKKNALKDGRCPECGIPVPGKWS